MFPCQNRPPLPRPDADFASVAGSRRGKASDGSGSRGCGGWVQVRLRAGALRSRGAFDLVEQIGDGNHAGQATDFARGPGDRLGFVSGL